MATIKLQNGDSLELLKQYPDNYFDSVVTDPPYGIGFMGKGWDKPENIAFNPEFWTEVYRVLKPGGHLLAFSASRTYHRMAVAIEDSGFEIRDQIMWIYGSGFPKSQDLGKAIDKKLGVEPIDTGIVQPNWLNKDGSITKRNIVGASEEIGHTYGFENAPTIKKPASEEAQQWEGWGSSLKPAHEPIVMARKPFKGTLVNNVMENGVGGINIDESRIPHNEKVTRDMYDNPSWKNTSKNGQGSQDDKADQLGRFPANVIHDGSEEVINAFPDSKGAGKSLPRTKVTGYENKNTGTGKADYLGGERIPFNSGEGSAARFFYGSKCSKVDRNEGLDDFEDLLANGDTSYKGHSASRKCSTCGKWEFSGSEHCTCENPTYEIHTAKNNHPTVKPTDLMAYLVRLVTPKDGIVLDPFNGSGSTGKAVVLLNKTENKNYSYVGMELDPQYIKITHARMLYTMHNKTWLEKKNAK